MSIVIKDDFTGRYKLAKTSFDYLNWYIDKYQVDYLIDLLGADLYNLFIADLSGSPSVPSDPRFLAIFNPFIIDDNNRLYRSEGIRTMLTQFTYYHYLLDTNFDHSSAGPVQQMAEVSKHLNYQGINIIEVYNNAIDTYQAIQWYICDYQDQDYPEENTQYKGYNSGI